MTEFASNSASQQTHYVASSTSSSSSSTITINSTSVVPDIPVEIVSEQEMAFFEAALAATRSSPISALSYSSPFRSNARSIGSIAALSNRRLGPGFSQPDIEDSGDFGCTQKRVRVVESLFQRFRKKTGLFVTDVTATEWCEKQMEFVLHHGKRYTTGAMKAGTARHTKLEEEVVRKVKVDIRSTEDAWALKFLNFITGVNQLLFDGLTRELPLIGFAGGVWMVGIVDEIRMPQGETNKNPVLVDTKTRLRDVLPSEPQRRNGRLQLMCYKFLWDNVVAKKFASKKFFDSFSLDPYNILSESVRENAANAGILAENLHDIVRYFRNTCATLPPADDWLLLRYELQKDNSLLGEDRFLYDPDWMMSQIQACLEFWHGERPANYTTEEERWKCGHCQFASACPSTKTSEVSGSATINNTSDK